MKAKLIINTEREGYSTEQVNRAMNVSELIRILEQYTPDTEIYLAFDNGYTYGTIKEYNITEE